MLFARNPTSRADFGQCRISAQFPEYAMLVRLVPIKTEQVQAPLGADEALVMFLAAPEQSKVTEEVFIWVVTKTDIRWARGDMGLSTLRSKITVLRKGLDAEDLKIAAASGGLFDLGLAHERYAVLLAPIADVLKDKPHLIIVATAMHCQAGSHLGTLKRAIRVRVAPRWRARVRRASGLRRPWDSLESRPLFL